nr:hypothetical protein [Streptomyces benahoarensis]
MHVAQRLREAGYGVPQLLGRGPPLDHQAIHVFQQVKGHLQLYGLHLVGERDQWRERRIG